MRKLMTVGLAGLTLAAGLATTTTAASAEVRVGQPGFERVQHYRGGNYNRGYNNGYYRRNNGGDAAAAAIVGGVLGFALGSTVNSQPRTYYPSYGYSNSYYAPRTYYAPRAYYAPRYYAPPPPRYYAPPPPRYYAPAPYYGGSCYDGYRYYC